MLIMIHLVLHACSPSFLSRRSSNILLIILTLVAVAYLFQHARRCAVITDLGLCAKSRAGDVHRINPGAAHIQGVYGSNSHMYISCSAQVRKQTGSNEAHLSLSTGEEPFH